MSDLALSPEELKLQKRREYQREYQRNYAKQYRENNKEKLAEAKQRWLENNPEYMENWRKERKEKNPEYHKAQYIKYRDNVRRHAYIQYHGVEPPEGWLDKIHKPCKYEKLVQEEINANNFEGENI